MQIAFRQYVPVCQGWSQDPEDPVDHPSAQMSQMLSILEHPEHGLAHGGMQRRWGREFDPVLFRMAHEASLALL